ncbi:MAG: PKD domain-containing protein [Bacteroidota bacterium]
MFRFSDRINNTVDRKVFIGLLSVLSVFSTTVWAQNANFSANVTSGCSPLVVNFDASASTGTAPLNYIWDFGNGNTTSGATKVTPGAIYTAPGTYTVTLRVEDANGNQSAPRTLAINVRQNPAANFALAGIGDGCAPLTVSFNDLSTPGSGAINSWIWDFGDGNSSTDQNPSHTYNLSGVYNVSLIVEDVNGCRDNFNIDGIVSVGQSADVDFGTVGAKSACANTLAVDFQDQSVLTGVGPFTYFWDFGDGNNANVQNPTHTYNGFGSYDVSLTVTDLSTNCQTTETKNGYVNLVDLNFNYTIDPEGGCLPHNIQVTNTSTFYNDLELTWNFGDGNTISGPSSDPGIWEPIHVYPNTGNYSVTLTVDLDNGACVMNFPYPNLIRVSDRPNIDFTAGQQTSCQAPYTTTFNSLTPNAQAWFWDFGDGTTSNQENPVKTYNIEGNFDVRLAVTTIEGCTDTLTREDFIVIAEPQVAFTSDIFENAFLPELWDNRDINFIAGGCIPLDITFTDLSVSPTPIVDWQWDFGDGNNGTGANPTNTYTVEGEYPVTLTITTQDGCMKSWTCDSCARAGEKPVALLDTVGYNYPLSQNCSAASYFKNGTDTSTIDYVWYYVTTQDWDGFQINDTTSGDWDFGSTVPVFRDSGQFVSTTFYAYNKGCVDIFELPDWTELHPPYPIAEFDTFRCESNFVPGVPFVIPIGSIGDYDSISISIQSLSRPRKFPTITIFNDTLPEFTFFDEDSIGIGLWVKNTQTGFSCRVYGETALQLKFPPTANIQADVTQGCGPLTVNFTANPGPDINRYRWSFGNNQFSEEENPTVVYNSPGTYTVTLEVTNRFGCSDFIVLEDYISVFGNQAAFDVCTLSGCAPLNIEVTDLSRGNNSIVNRIWDMGNGDVINNDSLFSYTYENVLPKPNLQVDGVYIKLTTTDENGCTSSDSVKVRPLKPIPEFSMEVFPLCDGDSVVFRATRNDTTGLGPFDFFWDLADGDFTSATGRRTSKVFPEGGPYNVSFVIQDFYGCSDTSAVQSFTVQPQGPTAAFSGDPLIATCPPLRVQFTDESVRGRSNIVEWDWNFGDGTRSTLQHPSKIYNENGVFDVRLTVTDSLGCSHTIRQDDLVNLNGITGNFSISEDVICINEMVSFDANSPQPGNFIWDFGDGNIAVGNTADHVYDSEGRKYPSLIIEEPTGTCATTFTDSLEVLPIPEVLLGPDDDLCIGESITLSPQSLGDYDYRWRTGETTTDLTVDATGIYLLTATDRITNCANQDSVNITVHDLPMLNAGEDRKLCEGDEATFTADGADNIVTFEWMRDAIPLGQGEELKLTITADQTIQVTATDNFGCINTDELVVTSVPPPDLNIDDAILCVGDSLLVNGVPSNIDDPEARYLWSLDGDLQSENSTGEYTVNTGGSYVMTYVLGECEAEEDFLIDEKDPPVVDIVDELFLCEDDNGILQLDAGPGTTYFWENTGETTQIIEVAERGAYYVNVFNEFNCVTRDSILVRDICPPQVYVPNAFSPNNDGINEAFTIRTDYVDDFILKIYNRWGELIYVSEDPAKAWDGFYNGQVVPIGVYPFLITYNGIHPDFQKNNTLEGKVTVVR